MRAPKHRPRSQPPSTLELKLAQFLLTPRAHGPFVLFGLCEADLGCHGFSWLTDRRTVHHPRMSRDYK